MANSNNNSGSISQETIAADYQMISKPGKYKVTVASTPGDWVNERLAKASDTYEKSILVNVKAIEQRKVKSVMDAFDAEGKIPYEKFGFNMTKEIIVHEGRDVPQLPVSGEEITILVSWAKHKRDNEETGIKAGAFVVDKENGAKILEITNFIVAQVSTGSSMADAFAKKGDVAQTKENLKTSNTEDF